MEKNTYILGEAVELSSAASALGDGFWAKAAALAPLAGPFVILGSAMIALAGIRKNAEINRKRATLDMIEKTESVPHYQ